MIVVFCTMKLGQNTGRVRKMLCEKCGEIMSEGYGSVMAKVADGWVITSVEVANCPNCDSTKITVEE